MHLFSLESMRGISNLSNNNLVSFGYLLLRGLNFADFTDLGKIAKKLSPGKKFATG